MIKKIFTLGLIILLLTGCGSVNTNELILLNSLVLELNTLEQFTSLDVSNKSINYQPVCQSEKEPCSNEKEKIEFVLNDLNIDPALFDDIDQKMSELNLLSYMRSDNYNLWVKEGAFGEIRGYAVLNKKLEDTEIEFKIAEKYYIRIGKNIGKNIFYFTGN